MDEFRPDEMSNLLYGLSLMKCNEMQTYHTAVSRCKQLLEDPSTVRDPPFSSSTTLS